MRNGQQMVGALDVIALMDALKIETAVFASLDWDGRTANILSALWPERCKALVFVGGYLIGSQVAKQLYEGMSKVLVSFPEQHWLHWRSIPMPCTLTIKQKRRMTKSLR